MSSPATRKSGRRCSTAPGQGHSETGSDIDLTLIGDLDLKELYLIMDELDDLLLPYTIDLSLYHDIDDPNVVEHIQRVGKVFYEQDMQSTFET